MELNKFQNDERMELIEKIEFVIHEGKDIKNSIWETNHRLIIQSANIYLLEYGRMPSKENLSMATGLSRQTIHKHIKECSTHPLFTEEIEQFKFMAVKVLAKVYEAAVEGDIKAARLYFEMVGSVTTGNNNTYIRNQNNNLQINSIQLNQETIKALTPGEMAEIESVLKNHY